ncbi:MAG: hypothetical protein CL814_04970 [Confluentimicrobium sp.]|nr:hypothetical protein [Actibacterium sp.]|tara:strand:+ start:2295 stop:2744 length:450 start_codon:yes stop_codon:yes gene_type:complete
MTFLKSACLMTLMALGTPVLAQSDEWANLGALIGSTLGPYTGDGGAVWLPDSADSARATEAIALLYQSSPTGGNAIQLTTGYFRKGANGFAFVGPLQGLFGMEPQDPRFFPDRIEVTTLTLGPDDPRCCPTKLIRWSIDRTTLRATQLP